MRRRRLQCFWAAFFACTYIYIDTSAVLIYLEDRARRPMRFEWDERKNQQNLAKHDVRFETAILVFDDPWALTQPDQFSHDEERWITLGAVGSGVVLFVVHTWLERGDEELIRIISARAATSGEKRSYEEAQQGAKARHRRPRRKKRRGY